MTKARPKRSAAGRSNLTNSEVAAYLRANPDFLCAHPDLIAGLQIPARDLGGGDPRIVDLQHYMLDRLRTQAHDLKHRHDELLDNSRCRLQTQSRIHFAALALLGARDLPHLIDIATTDLAVLMDMDVVALCVESADVPRVTADGVRLLPNGCIDELLGQRDILIHEKTTGDSQIYGAAAGLVEAQILLRLHVRDEPPDALLALGASRPNHIHQGQTTEALGFLARILEHSVRSWLEFPQ
ncbi:MAG: DUF484 family protein [Alphaproteobacteria bacterium]